MELITHVKIANRIKEINRRVRDVCLTKKEKEPVYLA